MKKMEKAMFIKFIKQKRMEILEVIGIFFVLYLIYLFATHFQMNCPEKPYDVWVKDSSVYVVMEKGDSILQYSFDGELEWTLGSQHYPKERIPIPLDQMDKR
ncbi:hypothetical protein ACFL2O_10395 [Thermodesulfobacteriota bacterium]